MEIAHDSQPVEALVKAVYALQQRQRPVPNHALKDRLGVSASAVSELVQQLAKRHLVDYRPYHGVQLTTAGERLALALIRRHRLVEAYLYQALDVPWTAVHAEAERLEHAVSAKLTARIALVLGHPSTSPYGAPIPDDNLDLPPAIGEPLLLAPCGCPLRVVAVDDAATDLLHRLAAVGLMPGQDLIIRGRSLAGEACQVEIAHVIHSIDEPTAAAVTVCARAA
jgi:DtxR family transcriptional regulator, Mn-dependent transcriptional regulator